MSQNEERKSAGEILKSWFEQGYWDNKFELPDIIHAMEEYASQRDTIKDELIKKQEKLIDYLYKALNKNTFGDIDYRLWYDEKINLESEISSL